MIPKSFDGRRLHRAWWSTPLFMTASIAGVIYLIGSMGGTPSSYHPGGASPVVLNAILISVILGIFGMVKGASYAGSVQSVLQHRLGVTNLPINHPLTQRVHGMAAKLSLPPPKVAIMRVANAYAIGRDINDAAVVIGLPLIQHMTTDELDAIIGHELGHIVSGDMRRMQYAESYQTMFGDIISGSIRALTQVLGKKKIDVQLGHNIGLLCRKIFLWFTEMIVKGTSRKREYYADAVGAMMTSNEAMASALRKIHNAPPRASQVDDRFACLMFRGSMGRLFSTHPSLEQRLQALEQGKHQQALLARAAGERVTPLEALDTLRYGLLRAAKKWLQRHLRQFAG